MNDGLAWAIDFLYSAILHEVAHADGRGALAMDKTLRCTVCTWRGPWPDASLAPRVRPRTLPASLVDIQAAYEAKQAASVRYGMTREPPCPKCGHHTIVVRRTPTFHPYM